MFAKVIQLGIIQVAKMNDRRPKIFQAGVMLSMDYCRFPVGRTLLVCQSYAAKIASRCWLIRVRLRRSKVLLKE